MARDDDSSRTGGDGAADIENPPASVGFNSNQLPLNTVDDGEASVESEIMGDETEDNMNEEEGDIFEVQGNLREWVTRGEVRRSIGRKFKNFLLTYVKPRSEPREIEYLKQINEMVSVNKCSLEIDFSGLGSVHRNIRTWLCDDPQPVLEVMEKVATKIVFGLHPYYRKIQQNIYVRITNLPVYYQIHQLRRTNLNTMIRTGGVVTQLSRVIPQLQQVKYDCDKCRAILGPFFQNSYSEVMVDSCPECQSKGPFTVNNEQIIYRNYQKLTLEESPETVPAGQLPRCMEVILLNDLIDCARPGAEIEVTGIYTIDFDSSLNTKNGFPVFTTAVEANYVATKQDFKLTQEDKEEIDKLAKDQRIDQQIVRSIAPSIFATVVRENQVRTPILYVALLEDPILEVEDTA